MSYLCGFIEVRIGHLTLAPYRHHHHPDDACAAGFGDINV
jgi:hypothetical protein